MSAAIRVATRVIDQDDFDGSVLTDGYVVTYVASNGTFKLKAAAGGGSPTGAAGGDLTGTYPNPTLADGTVDTAELVAGAVTEAKQTLADNNTGNVNTSRHGYAPKAPNDATKFLDGTGAYAVPAYTSISGTPSSLPPSGSAGGDLTGTYPNPTLANATVDTAELVDGAATEAKQTLADNTTWDVSITRHGYAPKAPNDATKYLDGTGAWTVPAGGSGAPGGIDKSIQFNNSGSFAGCPNLLIDTAAKVVEVIDTAGSPLSMIQIDYDAGIRTTEFNGSSGAVVLLTLDAFHDRIGWFNASAVGQQSGDIGTALANYGLVTSPSLPYGSLTGAPSALPPSGSAGGDLTGTYPNPTIAAGAVTEAKQTLADNNTCDVSIAQHGYAPKLPNDATKFLDGTGAYTVPAYASISGTPSALPPNGSAGGDLTGTYPNPTIATVSYVPANSMNWAGPAPTELKNAVDRLAAWIAANGTVFTALGITTQP